MSRRGELDAIIVGGGAIGAALALGLARDGLDVALVEARAPKPWRADDEVDLRVVALAADARALFEDLGVWNAIADARVGPYRRMRVWDALAPGELTFDAAEYGEAALGWIIENRLIQHALWQAVEAGRNARVVCPGEVASIENGAEGVEAVLADGTRLRARVAIAADGAESPVRAMLGIGANGRDYVQRGVVANVATAREHEHTAWQRFLPTGPLAFLPLADGRCSIVWTLPDTEAARVLALDDAAFRAELGAAFDFRLGEITATTARAAFPLRMRLADRYASGRVALAGDAAHVVHPLAGQGMNLGFRDVACLRRVLRDANARGGDIGAAHVLRRYERERRSENALAARGLDAISRLFGATDPVTPKLRGAGLAIVDRLAPVKHVFAAIAEGRI
ncbi:MAG TPA: UbiH/UbiF/VisC/COQ6 family ubiquinone biosynthesis hydroxylase [Rhodanobacteraceae bacterium]|nr:UbiH/UbiF/VisC/COQ6 family ubiquinone biosynthesis hydroxylase [Rhodanobacteraceae bacterium]